MLCKRQKRRPRYSVQRIRLIYIHQLPYLKKKVNRDNSARKSRLARARVGVGAFAKQHIAISVCREFIKCKPEVTREHISCSHHASIYRADNPPVKPLSNIDWTAWLIPMLLFELFSGREREFGSDHIAPELVHAYKNTKPCIHANLRYMNDTATTARAPSVPNLARAPQPPPVTRQGAKIRVSRVHSCSQTSRRDR